MDVYFKGNKVVVDSNQSESVVNFSFSSGTIAAVTGSVTTGGTGKISELFEMKFGDTLIFESNPIYEIYAPIWEYDSDGNALNRVLKYTASKNTYRYTEKRGGVHYFRISSYGSSNIDKAKVVHNFDAFDTDYWYGLSGYEYMKHIFTKVICIGDSLTQGVYCNKYPYAESYPDFLAKMTGWTVTNAGVASATTKSYWESNLKNFTFNDKDACFIYLGTNGGYTDTLESDTSAENYEDYADTNTGSYCKIIEYILEQNPNIKIFVLTNDAEVKSDVRYKIAEKYSIPLIGIYRNDVTHLPSNFTYHPSNYDRIHFGRIGYLELAMSVYRGVTQYMVNHKGDFEYGTSFTPPES